MKSNNIYEHNGKTIGISKEGIKIINCSNCGFYHQKPLPEVIERERYYEKEYFQETKSDYFEKQKEDLHFLTTVYIEKEEILANNISPLPKKILDIGAGSGFFLNFLREKGWDISGIEPNEMVCNLVKEELKIDLKSCSFEKFMEINKESFSVVHLSYILEHIIDPTSMLKKIYNDLLLSNGLLYIEVPNDFNPLQQIVYSKIKNNWWIVKDHINYFTPITLRKLLEQIGFNVLHLGVSFPLEFFILMGDDYITDSNLGRPSHLRRINFEKNLDLFNKNLKKELYKKFLELRIGRAITIIGRKNK